MSEHKKRENVGDKKLFDLGVAELFFGLLTYFSLIGIFLAVAFTGVYFSSVSFLVYAPFFVLALYLATSKNGYALFQKLTLFSSTIVLLVLIGGVTPMSTKSDGFYSLFYLVFGLPALIATVVFFIIGLTYKK